MKKRATYDASRQQTGVRTLAAALLTPWLVLQGCAKQEEPAQETGKTSATKQAVQNGPTLRTEEGAEYLPGKLIVRFKDGATKEMAASLHSKLGAQVVKTFKTMPDLQVVAVRGDLKDAQAAYLADPRVAYAEPNYVYRISGARTQAMPSDSRFGELWGMHNTGQSGGVADTDINAPEAWELTTGSDTAGVITVIDTGIDYTHPDLKDNVWVNPGEIAGNGVDDDANGYVDDVHGINAITGSGNPMDDNDHGSHCMGSIAGRGNNGVGVAGVNWTAKVMGCKFLDASGSGSLEDAITCFDYVHMMKTRANNPVNIVATSNSWGGGGFSQAMLDGIIQHRNDGTLFIAAAGNAAANNDTTAAYPNTYFVSNVISVGAHDRSNNLASFSSYGRRNVHITAPGVAVLSTTPGNTYQSFDGTSMATPHVSGLVALLKAQDPSRDWVQLKNLVLTGGVAAPHANNKTLTGKRLRAVDAGGKGSLTCVDQKLQTRVRPIANSVSASLGQKVELIAYNINCANPAGKPTITVAPTGETVELVDNGKYGDQVAGDGMYTGYFEPNATGAYTLTFPDGELLTVTTAASYVESPAPYAWRTITGTGLGLTDDSSATVTSPFPIPFAGGPGQTSLRVNMNGALSFGTSGTITWTNAALPSTAAPTLVAPFWDDLFPGPTTTTDNVFWQVLGTAPNRELVIEWRNVYHRDQRAAPANTLTFQAVFFEGKPDILFNYQDVLVGGTQDKGASATVGVQSAATSATQHSFNTASVENSSAILWKMPTPSQAPVLADLVVSPSSLTEGDALTISSSFTDPDGDTDGPFKVEFDMDYPGWFTPDQEFIQAAQGDISASGQVLVSGEVQVAIRVADKNNARSLAKKAIITVADVAPTLSVASAEVSANERQPVTLSATFVDPGADQPWTVEWDFNYDGTTFTADSRVQSVTAGNSSVTTTFPNDGAYQVAVRVKDYEGITSNVEVFTVNVADLAPGIAPLAGASTIQEGDTLELASAFTDPGDGSSPWKVQWDFDYDGATFTVDAEDERTEAGALAYKRFMQDSGAFTIAVRVVDADGSVSELKTVDVTAADVSPLLSNFVAQSLSATQSEPQTVDFRLTAKAGSDIAPEVDPIQAYLWDFDNDGEFDYLSTTPRSLYRYQDNPADGGGVYTVRVRVEDEDSYTEEFVNVTVLNAAPELAAIANQTVVEKSLLSLRVLATDKGADTLTFSLANAPAGMSITPDGLIFWQPTHQQAKKGGQDYVVSVIVTDDDGDSDVQDVTFTAINAAPRLTVVPAVNAMEGSLASARAIATDEGGGPLSFSLSGAPQGMSITADGLILWTPAYGQTSAQGKSYDVTVSVTDDDGDSDSKTVTFTARWMDTDGDGMPDTWEKANGTNPTVADANADSNHDGVSNMAEFSSVNGGPVLPDAAAAQGPLSGDKVTTAALTLTTNNVANAGSLAARKYQFQLFSDASLTTKVRDVTVDEDASGMTAAALTDGAESDELADLVDDAAYSWRVRATDGQFHGAWSAVQTITYNPVNDAPSVARGVQPLPASQVSTFSPVLTVDNATDVDDAALTYTFEVGEDAALTQGVQTSAAINGGARGSTSWAVPTALKDRTTYYWRVTAVDPHGASTQGEVASFTVFMGRAPNRQPGIPGLSTVAVVETAQPMLMADAAEDLDGDTLTYLFELDTLASFSSADYQSSDATVAANGQVSWQPTSLKENTRYYWRVRAMDSVSASDWALGSFVVNARNDAPSAPVALSPSEALIISLKPTLTVQNAADPEGDAVTYEFEVRNADGSVAESITGVAAGANGTTSATLTKDLAKGKEYKWVAYATDAKGEKSPVSASAGFQVYEAPVVQTPPQADSGCSAAPGASAAGLLPMLALALGLLGRRRRNS